MATRADPGRLCGGTVAIIAALAMLGWILGIEPLKSVFPGLAAMNPLTALLFIAAGLALALPEAESLILPAGLLVGLMGLLRLLSFAGWDLGLDTLMFRGALEAYSPPNRMAPNTALGFLLTGPALAFLERRDALGSKISQALALAAAGLSQFAILGYSYRVAPFYSVGSFMPMALNTALCFGLLACAALLARRGEGWMACLSDEGPGGIMARRLLPFTLLGPALLGFLRLKGEWAGWYATETGTALYALVLIAVLSWLVWYDALLMGRIDLARRASERERERYARFYSLSVDMFCIADFDGRFEEVSDAWEAVLGHPKEELLKRPYLDFVHPEDREKTSTEAVRNSSGATTLSFENRYRCKDGSYRWLLWTARPVMEEKRIYAVARDITERKHNELDLQDYTDKLEQANRELDSFSYSVSHDLRAPLRAIAGFSRILEEDHAPRLDAEGRRLLGVVCANASRMGKLIDDLLAFSRLGRTSLEKARIDMEALADSVVAQLRAAEPRRAVAVERKPLPPARGDAALLQQAVTNLLANAFKFTRHKQGARIEIGLRNRPEGPAYYVADNGAGFDMRYSQKLFGVFQRLHCADEFEGTGIGLALVQRIISRHGGRVWAEGKPGEGATFYFILPDTGGEKT